ncbi:hypothetical protein [Nonomuraea sp. NPDC049400]|uniref:pectate lyase family protein n=1 Tax=Nonomuraea sp. NPDC049400 TaxID=3364352 RepID=UPI0037BAE3CA
MVSVLVSAEPALAAESSPVGFAGMNGGTTGGAGGSTVGSGSGLNGGGLTMNGVSNIIIRNLTIQNSRDDAINVQDGSHHIWIDHNNFTRASDGLSRNASSVATIPYSYTPGVQLLGEVDGHCRRWRGQDRPLRSGAGRASERPTRPPALPRHLLQTSPAGIMLPRGREGSAPPSFTV